MSTRWICRACGVQFAAAARTPQHCPICEDDRQYVPPEGQAWTSLEELRASHRNRIEELEPGVWAIHTEPRFAIGQHAFLIQTPAGNLLWDCITLVDGDTIDRIRAIGGIQAIAISHPHYYSGMLEWSEAFGAPVWIHAADRDWIPAPSPAIRLWDAATQPLFGGITLVHSPGHFDGYQVAHHPETADGAGALFAGDQPQVCFDGKWLTFMYSYPNWIPLNAGAVRKITRTLAPLRFDRLYGAFGRHILRDAKGVVERSEQRYLRAIGA